MTSAAAEDERDQPPDPEDDPQVIFDLAEAKMACAKYAEARPLFERLVTMAEAQKGTDHPAVANTLNSLAQALYFLGDFSLAQSTAERALDIRERFLGPNHPDVARSLFQLARVLKEQNQLRRYHPLYPFGLAHQFGFAFFML